MTMENLPVHDYRFAALSVFLTIFTVYTALKLAGRVAYAEKTARILWLTGGATAIGVGLWAAHFVGMATFTLSVPVLYNWPEVLLSLLAAITTSALTLFLATRSKMGWLAPAVGSIFVAWGIVSMHLIAVAAMGIPATRLYSLGLTILSGVLTIVVSYLLLRLSFAFRLQISSWNRREFLCAVLLGAAISVTQYVAAAAATFVIGGAVLNSGHAIPLSALGLISIVATTLIVLAMSLVIAVADRKLQSRDQELVESRLKSQSIFDGISDGIVVFDLKKNTLQSNRAARRFLGLTSSSVTIQAFRDNFEIVSPTGQPVPREDWPASLALRGQFLEHRELRIHRTDIDKTSIVEVSTAPLRDLKGDVIQVILCYYDITQHKLNTDVYARLAAIVNSSEDAIIGKDETGIVRTWNAAAERIFGYKAEEMIGQSIQWIVPADREQEEQNFVDRIKRGEIIDHIETVRKTKSGKPVHVSLTISPIRDEHGNIVGASKMARDITARKKLEQQLQQSQKMEAIGQLTGGIAHDFNNLLGVIVGNLSLVEQMVGDNAPALKRIEVAQKAAARGADLTRRLLASSSNEDLQPDATILEESIRNTIELAARTLGPEIKIATKLGEGIPTVFVDPAGLENALLNLVVNARDAMPRGGCLTITSELVSLEDSYPPVKAGELAAGSYAAVSVTDTGEGMSREVIERALEPFFTTKARGKGTGLGLAMVYGFVKQTGGYIGLYSEIGHGTTVTLYLPLAKERISAPKAVLKNHVPSSIGGKVLVVDDEFDLLEVAVTYLEQMGYTAFRAQDGAGALKIVADEKNIDLVLTDVIMPGGMNGVELVQKIRELIPSIKVIYSSGFPSDPLTERSGTAVDGQLLRKPYQRAEFDAVVRRTLAGVDLSATEQIQSVLGSK